MNEGEHCHCSALSFYKNNILLIDLKIGTGLITMKLTTNNWEYQLKNVKEDTPEQLERAYSRLQKHFEDISIR
jgi:hypothetical protein